MSKVRGNVKDSKLGKQEVLQALILADDFGTSLMPLQNVVPSVLTQVANANLLDYLIESLIQSGVQEVFLYCSNHVDNLKSYVAKKNYSDISVSLIISDGCRSLGDALRDIDTKGILRGDFILIRGNAFINANLTSLMDLHRTRRERDKGSTMTLILRDVGSTNESLLYQEVCNFVAVKQNKKVLFFKKPDVHEKKIKFELEWFLEHEQIEINSGFIDSHVYICSPAVLPLFSDNFDFQTMEDFIRGVLMNEEILDARIYWQPLRFDEYALPITSWPAYHILSHDILQRQGYPLTPDMLPPLRGIVYSSRSLYKQRSATLARGCILQKETIVGHKSELGKNTKVSRSVIGDDCIIGENVEIEDSYILGNVVIKDNCRIKDSVLLSKCSVGKSSNIDGCILSTGVILPPESSETDVILEQYENKFISRKMSERDEDDEEFIYFKGNLFSACVDNNCDTDDSSSEVDSRAESPIPDDTHLFFSEVVDSLLRGYQEKLDCDNLILEINSSRYAYNVGIREVTYNVVKAILMLPVQYLNETNTTLTKASYRTRLNDMMTFFNAILLNYIKTENAQDDCLKAFEEVTGTIEEALAYSHHILDRFYKVDFLSEEKILEWYHREPVEGEKAFSKKIREAAEPFIDWLTVAEEESSDDSE